MRNAPFGVKYHPDPRGIRFKAKTKTEYSRELKKKKEKKKEVK